MFGTAQHSEYYCSVPPCLHLCLHDLDGHLPAPPPAQHDRPEGPPAQHHTVPRQALRLQPQSEVGVDRSAAMKQRQWQQKNSNLLGVEQQTAVSMPGEAAREGSCQGVSIVYRA